jgi:hypothetical protein
MHLCVSHCNEMHKVPGSRSRSTCSLWLWLPQRPRRSFWFLSQTLIILSTNDTVSAILGIMKAFLLHQNLCLSARRLCFKCKFSSITLKLVVVPSHIHKSPNNNKASFLQHMTIYVHNTTWNEITAHLIHLSCARCPILAAIAKYACPWPPTLRGTQCSGNPARKLALWLSLFIVRGRKLVLRANAIRFSWLIVHRG